MSRLNPSRTIASSSARRVGGEIDCPEPLPVLFHQPRGKSERGRGGEILDLARSVASSANALRFFASRRATLFVRRAHDPEDRFPAGRHFRHDVSEGMTGGARFRFHRAGAGVKDEGPLRKEREGEKDEQNGSASRENQTRRRKVRRTYRLTRRRIQSLRGGRERRG